MELLPAVLPPELDGLGERVREDRTDLRLACSVRVDGELRRRILLALLEAGREALDDPRARNLRVRGRNDDRDATNLA
jgi:hypothetical protein